MRRYFASFAALFLLSACAQNASNTGPTLSCNFPSNDYCFDYTSGYSLAIAQESCGANGGTFSNSANCATTSRVGSCTIPNTTTDQTYVQRYYSPHWTTTTAQTDCASAGVAATFAPN